MRGTKKYSDKQDNEFTMAILGVLSESPVAITIDEIKLRDMTLTNLTSQKISRILANLIDMGLAKRAKSKKLKRMVYIAVCQLEEQGYDVDEI